MSKLGAARHQRQLLEIQKNVPGNDCCADCGRRNPRWTSVNLGIFLCERCAGVHRAMGTHISKVKAITLDVWTKEQVAQMKEMGNAKSNKIWDPYPDINAIPIDFEDRQLDRWIRQKYEAKAFVNRRPRKAPSPSPSPPPPPPARPGAHQTASSTSSTPNRQPGPSSSLKPPRPPPLASNTLPIQRAPGPFIEPFRRPSAPPESSSSSAHIPTRSASQPVTAPAAPPSQPAQPPNNVWSDLSGLNPWLDRADPQMAQNLAASDALVEQNKAALQAQASIDARPGAMPLMRNQAIALGQAVFQPQLQQQQQQQYLQPQMTSNPFLNLNGNGQAGGFQPQPQLQVQVPASTPATTTGFSIGSTAFSPQPGMGAGNPYLNLNGNSPSSATTPPNNQFGMGMNATGMTNMNGGGGGSAIANPFGPSGAGPVQQPFNPYNNSGGFPNGAPVSQAFGPPAGGMGGNNPFFASFGSPQQMQTQQQPQGFPFH